MKLFSDALDFFELTVFLKVWSVLSAIGSVISRIYGTYSLFEVGWRWLVLAIMLAFVVLLVTFVLFRYNKSVQYNTLDDFMGKVNGIKISGVVVDVIDGDTFKFYHCTSSNHSVRGRKFKPLTVRLAGVDAPEISHNGRPGQKFGMEAKAYAERVLLREKRVKLCVMSIDLYGRLVAAVSLPRWFSESDLSILLLRKGLACVYRGKDRVLRTNLYGDFLRRLKREEMKASSIKIGIWSDPEFVFPNEYRKRRGGKKQAN